MRLYYPIALKLKGKDVLVVGGGQVAERKAKTLLSFGAQVKVVSPILTSKLKKLYLQRKIRWIKRKVESCDFKGISLVIAATNDEFVNRTVSKWAKKQNILVNVVDNAGLSDFISPAIFGKGGTVIAVSTNGKDPVLSRDLKNFLKEKWDDFLSYRDRL